MTEKSLLDLAYELLLSRDEPVSFKDIWQEVMSKIDNPTVDKMSRFYTNLSLDGRFVAKGSNMWDLRIKYTYKELYEDVLGVFVAGEKLEAEKEVDPFDEPEEEDLDELVDEDEENEEDIDDEEKLVSDKDDDY